MPQKIIEVAGLGPVTVVRRRGARSIRLSTDNGIIRVSVPYWTPYSAGTAFAASKADWLRQQLAHRPPAILTAGQAIGKAHHISFIPGKTVGARIIGTTIVVAYPADLSSDNLAVQAKARQAALRALRKEAEKLLPVRVERLASQYGYNYRAITVKQLKRRWGSCDQLKNLTFNLFLMQLPWDLIDYVILHELNHTRHLNHSPAFWGALADILPELTTIRKRMRTHQPTISA